ncbi:acyltransferase 3 [Novosphingobium nitrogenifigens DSM 19370]|uniref:Acyltransferase 3 n=1 Tax=Novosphingobium nitrogenifigens DSM 19370 TaxID=983920 RepID=F1Z654_9SPHN|nr:acyltransferase [Novosphingobium nitrogenifigens]EGD59836.1 acyltransferase 3 [Novosphingobium nitrogenifigens DSM 19370]
MTQEQAARTPRATRPGLRLPKRHFNALDFSRLIAACGVLFWHYQHFFVPPVDYEFHVRRSISPFYHQLAWIYDYGHVAVQYFWAVSGFVFAHVYLADMSGRGRFWLARVARLWPLHVLTLCLVAVLQAVYTGLHGTGFIYHHQDLRHFLLNLVMANYWGFQDNQSFNGPSWSLSTEMVAYAVFWLLLPALRRLPIAMALPVALAMFTLVFDDILSPTAPADSLPAKMVPVVSCIGYFFGGAMVYGATLKGWLRAPVLAALSPVLALVAWHVSGMKSHGHDAAILTGTFAVLFLMVAIDLSDHDDRLRLGRKLGDASYGIYLWHFPLQLALVLLVDATIGTRAVFREGWMLNVFIVVAILAGFASHRWIERPAQRVILRLAERLKAS